MTNPEKVPDLTVTAQDQSSLSDQFETRLPSVRNGLDIFKGKWISKVPCFGYGEAAVFEDGRLSLFDEAIGGFAGKRVIELGPLDGAHTFMMSAMGAAQILSIEANKDAFLRCLVLKEAFNINARFLCGDFEKYLLARPPRVDVILASGVLYHMTQPLKLIEAMAATADSICVWTHYYSRQEIESVDHLRTKFSDVRKIAFHGRTITVARAITPT